jgi:putative effector of murein hydrolase
MSIILTFVWILLMVFTFIKARDFDRSVIGWLFVGLITTPILAIVLLYLLGENYDRRN